MSYLIAAPETLAAADVSGIGSSLRAANSAAAGPSTTLLAAAGDEVSAAIASVFAGHADQYQALSAQRVRPPSVVVDGQVGQASQLSP
jgi:PE family